ncbi:TonB-dependent receptor [Brevundimonas sp.]|uniref:TonB-dependent receptor family protein n=1 Tax=Brevundimonas sp. TaxID=1871086 RepID=UPI002B758B8A|nr:TonB-dependent receptor [Brevundimonas sp.]HWQ87306.1 TonB-dependent receptor [Brevundimonas sp.]
MRRIKQPAFGVAFALAAGWSFEVAAQSVAPGSEAAYSLTEIVVTAPRTEQTEARARAALTPGGASVISAVAFEDQGGVRLAEALAFAPGAIVQAFFGGDDQPRLQLRGSGLQQNPAERGVLFLQDGLPLNRADGSYVVGLVDPRQATFIEIFRGYTANRLGSAALGGALNFVSPSGEAAAGLRGRIEGGAHGYLYGLAEGGIEAGPWSASGAISYSARNGYRTYNDAGRVSVLLSAEARPASGVSTRFLAGHVENIFDVAGPLSAQALARDPRQVSTGPVVVNGVAGQPGPNVVRDRPQRDTRLTWVGNRTTVRRGRHAIDAAASYVHADDSFRFPVSAGYRDTRGGDVNLMARYAVLDADDGLPPLEIAGHLSTGSADRVYMLNAAGQRGALFGKGKLDASTWGLNLTANLSLRPGLTLSPSLSYVHADRGFADTYSETTRPTLAFNPLNPAQRLPDGAVTTVDSSYDRSWRTLNPALALSWRPAAGSLIYAAVSRGFEPPSHDDLIATVNGTPNSSPGRPNPGNPGLPAEVFRTPDLKGQTSDTVEVGWRGGRGALRFDGLVYHSWVEGELLSLRDATGVSLGAVNAGDTRHLGLELGLEADFGERTTGRLGYAYQDFRFVDDPLRGDNRLAGAPPHVVNADLRYAATSALTLAASVHWRPSRTPVDNMNTLYNNAFATVDLRAVYTVKPGIVAFVEVRNVLDEVYASSTLVVDQARPDQAVFLPGDGRALIAGLRAAF